MMSVVPQDKDVVLIGVDGGATVAKAHHVVCDNLAQPQSFALGEAAAARTYERMPEFEPVPIGTQLAERDAGKIQLSPKEQIQGSVWIQAVCDAVAEVVQTVAEDRPVKVLLGMGMPGLKTPDARGISAINNGPRIPDYLEQCERRLGQVGVQLAAPVAALGSDADYCGIGELYAESGLFRDVENSYYVGCGTGIADALKLRGKLVPFDAAKTWIQKSWQIPSSLGPTFEKLVSAKSMNDCYARLLGRDPLDEPRYPEVDAAEGQAIAIAWMDTVALLLAELIYERIDTIQNGRSDLLHRGPGYHHLAPSHSFRGVVLERVIVGQRIGQIYAHRRYRPVFADKLEQYLAAAIMSAGNHKLMAAFLENGEKLRTGFLRASRLRAAPALGAAISAVQAFTTHKS
jgi:predicted NBD/HSP70 family sugar kinase